MKTLYSREAPAQPVSKTVGTEPGPSTPSTSASASLWRDDLCAVRSGFARAFLLVMVLLCLPAAPAVSSQYVPVDGFAASVNRRIITVGEVMSALQPMEQRLRSRYSGQELIVRLEEAYEQVLQGMVEQALILEEFDRKEGEIPPQIVDEHIQTIVVENFEGDRSHLVRELEREGIGMAEWRDDVKDQLAIRMMRGEEIFPNVVVSPRQIRSAYEERMDEFKEPAKARVRMIRIDKDPEEEPETEPAKRAETVRQKAVDDGDFAELARRFSQDARAERGGDRGWIEPDLLRDELAAAVKALEPGGVSPVIATPDAFYIVHVEEKREASLTSFDEVRDQLAAEVRRAEEERLYRSWMDRLRNRNHVQIYDLQQTNPSL